jgi:hypothetical protein
MLQQLLLVQRELLQPLLPQLHCLLDHSREAGAHYV